ncbi:hypothetical protein [Spiroplasma endosymbiont of Nebria brevicollis]
MFPSYGIHSWAKCANQFTNKTLPSKQLGHFLLKTIPYSSAKSFKSWW